MALKEVATLSRAFQNANARVRLIPPPPLLKVTSYLLSSVIGRTIPPPLLTHHNYLH
jgi:hypothetical protein